VASSTPLCTGFASKVEIIVMGVRVATVRACHYGLEELSEQLSPEPGVVPYSVQVRSAFLRCDTRGADKCFEVGQVSRGFERREDRSVVSLGERQADRQTT
jgi:hypothetical protein